MPSLRHPVRPHQDRRIIAEIVPTVFRDQLGLARLRGMGCRARYAEAFSCAKSLLVPAARHDEGGT